MLFILQDRDRKLRIFPGSEHPFGDRPLEPYVMPPRKVREMRPRTRRAMVRAQKKAEQQQEDANDPRKGRKKDTRELVASSYSSLFGLMKVVEQPPKMGLQSRLSWSSAFPIPMFDESSFLRIVFRCFIFIFIFFSKETEVCGQIFQQ